MKFRSFHVFVSVSFVLLSGVLLPDPCFPDSPEKASLSEPIKIPQGDVLIFSLPPEIRGETVEGKLRGRKVPFFSSHPGEPFSALLGADLDDKPALEELVVTVRYPDKRPDEIFRFPVEILPVNFVRQELTVPDKYVDLEPETLERVGREKEIIMGTMKPVSPEKIWDPPFLKPVEGKISGAFGKRRVFNGQSRRPHSGEDIAAPLGAPVQSPNKGVVTLVGDFFFTGNSVFIDHGLGLYSMFFHLDTIDVGQGDRVGKGEIIGTVGSTGRATGPHLHWGMRLNGARVNPISFLNIQ